MTFHFFGVCLVVYEPDDGEFEIEVQVSGYDKEIQPFILVWPPIWEDQTTWGSTTWTPHIAQEIGDGEGLENMIVTIKEENNVPHFILLNPMEELRLVNIC